MITHSGLTSFCNETLRPLADLLAGVLNTPTTVLNAVAGKDLAAVLGTTDAEINRAESWGPEDYAKLGEPQVIADSDSGGRTELTNYDVVAILRVIVVLKLMMGANPQLGPLVAKFAVNPRV